MKKLLIALAATTMLTSVANASVSDYVADEGSYATFADGVENGYFDSTVENKIKFFFLTGGAIDTDIGVLTGYLNGRGNIVFSLEATDFDSDVVLKYRPLQDNFRLEVGGKYIIGDTVAHLQEWIANDDYITHDDMAGLESWLVDANADFNRGEHWMATLEEHLS